MATITAAVRRLGTCALTLLCVWGAGAQPPKTNKEVDQADVRRALFESLLMSNFDYWTQLAEKEVLLLDARLRNEENQAQDKNALEINQRRKSALATLRSVLVSGSTGESAVLSRFQLALLLSADPANRREARQFADEAVEIGSNLATLVVEKRLFARVALLSGELAFLDGDTDIAAKRFQQVLETTKERRASVALENTRALIGLGDAAFVNFNYSEASSHYEKALRGISLSSEQNNALQAPFAHFIQVRLAWSAFRNGNARASIKWVLEYGREAASSRVVLPQPVVRDLSRIGALSLFDVNDSKMYSLYARDVLANDFSKRIVVSSFQHFLKAGRAVEVEPLALLLEPEFLNSRELLNFQAQRLDALARANASTTFYENSKKLVDWGAQKQIWKRKFELSEAEEKRRSELVAAYSIRAAAYYFSQAEATRLREPALISLGLYKARLNEFVEGEKRGSLMLSAARSALLAGDLPEAWEMARGSLRFGLSSNDERAALSTLADVAKKQSEKATSRSDQSVQKYERAVDVFVERFPLEVGARQGLVESAARAETLGDNAEARVRYERLLRLLSLKPQGVTNELDQTVRALVKIHLSNSNTEVASRSMSDLENALLTIPMSEVLRREIETASAAAIRAHAVSLRRAGKLQDAQSQVFSWVREHELNREAPSLLLEAIRSSADLMQWNKVVEQSNFFQARFAKHPLVYEALYWKGRALESNVAFASAALQYLDASLSESSTLTVKERLESLERAEDIFAQTGEQVTSAMLLEKISQLKNQNGQEEESSTLRIRAAEKFALLKRFKEAKTLFASLSSNKKLSFVKSRRVALGFISVRLNEGSEPQRAVRDLENYVVDNLKYEKKSKAGEDLSAYTAQAIGQLNVLDSRSLNQLRAAPPEESIASRVAQMRQIQERTMSRDKLLKGNASANLRQMMNLQLGQTHQFVAAELARLSSQTLRMQQSRRESLLRESEQTQDLARRHFFSALASANSQSPQRAQAFRGLQNFESLPARMQPSGTLLEPRGDVVSTVAPDLVASIGEMP